MKAFNGPFRTRETAGLILLFDGEVDWGGISRALASTATIHSNHDEHSQTDILTSGLDLAPAFPVSRTCGTPVAWWEFVSRHSGATVPDSHGVPGQ